MVRTGFSSFERSLSYLPTSKSMTSTARIVSMVLATSCGLTRFSVLSFRQNFGTKTRRLSSPALRHGKSCLSPLTLTPTSLSMSISTSNSSGNVCSSSTTTPPLDENYFLHQVETTIENVFRRQEDYGKPGEVNILDLPEKEREAFGIARNLDKRLKSLRKNNDCPRCWMQRKHCICNQCSSVVNDDGGLCGGNNESSGSLKRIFLVMHHKEIGLKIDTAKLILAAFPFQCELVVGGIGPEHQGSMKEMLESIQDSKRTSLLLFPDESAITLKDIVRQNRGADNRTPEKGEESKLHRHVHEETTYDLIVLDGTWAQARKFHSRYFASENLPQSLQLVQLSEASVELLQDGSTETGHQLRRHDIAWRQVGTFEAFRLFMRDWSREFPSNSEGAEALEFWQQIESYQRISNDAALKELGPPR